MEKLDKPSFKLVGAPCGHHGQYTFYKAIRLTGPNDRIVAIGDFFFVRIWQDSELVSIGELQLLWTDRVSDQTLVSLRLYFLPENTPDGRSTHGEHEVLAINDKVVLRAEDLLSWVCDGRDWTWGLKAVWRGACAPPADARHTNPLHHTKLDFSDVEKEKNSMAVDVEAPGVVVFSYPRYCRYRALLARLEGIQADWLRDSLVAALGGYAAPTHNTRILYCKDTFEYPELEGHEFVCNHLAPKLKGRPRGRRRRPPRSRTQSPESRSSDEEHSVKIDATPPPRRLSLRIGVEKRSSDSDPDRDPNVSEEDRAFLRQLKQFYKASDVSFNQATSLKHLSLRVLYSMVTSRGGYEAVSRHKLWRVLFADQPAYTRRHYERYLLPFENHERRNGVKPNGITESLDTITVCDSPPPPHHPPCHPPSDARVDSETGEIKEDMNITSKPAEELNREFLDSLPREEKDKPLKITVKPVEKLIDPPGAREPLDERREGKEFFSELANKLNLGNADQTFLKEMARAQSAASSISSSLALIPSAGAPAALPHPAPSHSAPALNGHAHNGAHTDPLGSRPLGRSSLRAVRVKPARLPAATSASAPHTAPNTPPVPPLRPDSASSSPPSLPPAPLVTSSAPPVTSSAPPVTNFGIHHPPPPINNSDDEIVEVPYNPKTPEIIDLDEYPESPQGLKKKKLDILKERGLEVTPLPAPVWPTPILANPLITPSPILLNPAVQHQIMTNAQLFQMYNIIPHNYNGMQPPKVIQATPLFGTTSPEKTVYGNPKDPFMPPPHVLHGVPIKQPRNIQTPVTPPHDILDLTCKLSSKPAVEIVRVPTTPSPKHQAQNLTKNYSIVDGKAVVGSNLEITLVNKNPPSPKLKAQKRSSNGKFTKTPTPPKEYPKPQTPYKKTPITVPNYQIREDSPTSSTSSQNSQKMSIPESPNPKPIASFLDPTKQVSQFLDPTKQVNQFLDPSKQVAQYLDPSKPVTSFLDPYMALYNLAGQMDPRQLAAYKEIMSNPFRYPNLLNMGVNPTTKN